MKRESKAESGPHTSPAMTTIERKIRCNSAWADEELPNLLPFSCRNANGIQYDFQNAIYRAFASTEPYRDLEARLSSLEEE